VILRVHLFTKIFLGFWLATIAVLASWLISNRYFDANPDRYAAMHRPHGPPQRFVLQMIYDLQNLDERGMAALVERASAEHDVDIYLLDRSDTDLLGRQVPPDVEQVAAELQGKRRRAYLNAGREHLLGHKIYRPERGQLRAVFVFRPSRHLLLGALGSNFWLRLGLAIAVSGLVCYLLSRVMSRRIRTLQLASRRLATGDLEARLQVRRWGLDETDELARDFNSMAQQLQERVEAQKRLLVDVSHELRSPLARLRIALALAQEHPDGSPAYLQRIERETERLEELISQLLASQAEGIELSDHIDLVQLLRQLCSDANFEGAAKGVQVVLLHSVAEAIVASSGDLLHKSFENILRNALAHTPDNSTVTVTLDLVDDRYRICVADQGGGVAEQELEKIFAAFYRSDTARARDTGGHGLGLAIARRAIDRHGGEVRAQNAASGLVVMITLPRLGEEPP
jgi:two-component system sensor histidine kinase CpxA